MKDLLRNTWHFFPKKSDSHFVDESICSYSKKYVSQKTIIQPVPLSFIFKNATAPNFIPLIMHWMLLSPLVLDASMKDAF